MKKRQKIELVQYITLLFMFIVASYIFSIVVDKLLKFYVILAFSFLYIVWGYWHHYNIKRLSLVVILEYSLVAVMVVLFAVLGLGLIRFL